MESNLVAFLSVAISTRIPALLAAARLLWCPLMDIFRNAAQATKSCSNWYSRLQVRQRCGVHLSPSAAPQRHAYSVGQAVKQEVSTSSRRTKKEDKNN